MTPLLLTTSVSIWLGGAAAASGAPPDAQPVVQRPSEAAPTEAAPTEAAPVEAPPVEAPPAEAAPAEPSPAADASPFPQDAAPAPQAPPGAAPLPSAPPVAQTTPPPAPAPYVAPEAAPAPSAADRQRTRSEEMLAAKERRDRTSGPPRDKARRLGWGITGTGLGLFAAASALQISALVKRGRCVSSFECTDSYEFASVGAMEVGLAQTLWIGSGAVLAGGGAVLGRGYEASQRAKTAMMVTGALTLTASVAGFFLLRMRNNSGLNTPECPLSDHASCVRSSMTKTEAGRFAVATGFAGGMFLLPFGKRLLLKNDRVAFLRRTQMGLRGNGDGAGLEIHGAF